MISRFGSVVPTWVLIVGAMIGIATVSIDAAQAQSNNDVANRITRLEAEIRDLQRHLFAGKSKPAPGISSTAVQETTLTPSQGGTEAATSMAARAEIRLQQLEAQMRNLTGKVEELDFKITQSIGRVDKLVSDLDRRFATLEGGTSQDQKTPDAASTGASLANPPTGDGATSSGGLFASPGASATKKTGVLGYLKESDLRQIEAGRRQEQTKAPSGAQQASVVPPSSASPPTAGASQGSGAILPEGDSATRYKHAFSYLMRHDYDTAEKAFREFVDVHGDDPLAGNAMYWLGETYYVREMFAESAVTFAEGYETYPGSPKTADNLLKLGFSLARLNRTDDACVALAQLSDEFPNASTTIKRRALIENKRIGCKG
jgi:tol-pal system protein YbgF